MKKSEQYKTAMIAVINSATIPVDAKVEVLETLVSDKKIAELSERPKEDAE